MRRHACLILSLSLLLAPALCLRAEEAAAQDESATAAKADEAKPAAQAAEPPALPGDVEEGEPAAPAAAPAAEPGLPKEEFKAPGKAVPEAKPSRFKFSNFVLGFLGGALLGSAYGVLSSGGKDDNARNTATALYGGAAGLGGGLIALLLGATTPEEARPPSVESGLPAPGVVLALRF